MPNRPLRLAYRDTDIFAVPLRGHLEAFRKVRPDIDVELVPFSMPDLERFVSGAGCTGGEFDLVLVVTDWLPALASSGAIRSLDPWFPAAPLPDWPAGWAPSLRRPVQGPDGTTYALPFHDGPEVFLYRGDLFDNPAEQAAFTARFGRPLRPPRTWAEFADVARFFSRPGADLFGCVLAALPDGHNNVYDFLIQLWSRGGRLLDGRRAAFAGPAGVAGLTFLRDLLADGLTQPNPRAVDSVASGDDYAAGRVAMMWNWSGFTVIAEAPRSKVRGRTRLGLIPRGAGPGGAHVSLVVFWALAVAAKASNPDAAYAFLRHVASPEMDLLTARSGAVGCRRSTWDDAAIRAAYPCYGLMAEVHAGARSMPAIPEYPRINEILSAAIDSVYTGSADVVAALAAAAERVDAVLAG